VPTLVIIKIFNGHYIPHTFCLLKDKNKRLILVCEKRLELNVVLCPTKIVIDYELAIHNACKDYIHKAEY